MSREFDSYDPPEANPDVRSPRAGRGAPTGPGAFVWESVRMAWRTLTRMKTALYLLAVLGILSLVATVVPQEPNVPTTADAWRAGTEGPGQAVAVLLDGFGAFDVYGSALFLALLLLLFLSLTACLLPRIRSWWRLTRSGRPPATRHLGSHPEQATFTTTTSPAAVDAAVRAELGRRRYRLRAPDPAPDSDGNDSTSTDRADVAAEKGIVSREGGSLLFHVSFYVLLVAVVMGQLLGFTGQVGVVEGRAFTDTELAYWTSTPGRWWGGDDHTGFTLTLDQFNVDWIRDPRFMGQPSLFLSEVTVETASGDIITDTVGGNDPLIVDGMKIHQLRWGYAPRIVVEKDGQVLHDAFLTTVDTGISFESAVKAPGADPDVGLEIELFPTAIDEQGNLILDRGLPWADAPLVLANVWEGDLRLDRAQNVNTLDTTDLDLVDQAVPLALGGEPYTTADGVTISFPELRRWVGFQVSNRPTAGWLLFGAVLLLAGLLPALYAYRRRIWVRAEASSDGGILVTVAGRAFQRPQAFTDEFGEIVERLRAVIGSEGVTADRTDDHAPSDRSAITIEGPR